MTKIYDLLDSQQRKKIEDYKKILKRKELNNKFKTFKKSNK